MIDWLIHDCDWKIKKIKEDGDSIVSSNKNRHIWVSTYNVTSYVVNISVPQKKKKIE